MFPPVSPDVLARNPQFAALYEQLATKILNPHDGSSKEKEETNATDGGARGSLEQVAKTSHKYHAVGPRQEIIPELRTCRAELAQMKIVQDALVELTGHAGNGFTDEVVTPTALSKQQAAMLNEEMDDFKDALPTIAQALSHHLTTLAAQLCALAFPTDPPPTTPSHLSHLLELLPAHVAHRRFLLAQNRHSLSLSLVTLTQLVSSLSAAYRQLSAQTLHAVETHKFGDAERAVRAQAACLDAVVQGIEGKLGVLKHEALAAIYNPEAVNALTNYRCHLLDTRARLQARQRTVEEELRRYGGAGSDMRELVGRYSRAMRAVEGLRREIGRLGGVYK
ncbi:hypothetical protein BDZ91DRAFT_795996 [Kalaharituber pfeilii]|nr:hypothetical protein BDZ91DRAFT_795996 [Kalaharituber pfeilii]